MKSDKLSNTLGLYLLLALGSMIAIGLLVVKPQYNAAEATRLKTQKVDKKTADLRQLGDDTKKLKDNYETIKSDKVRILSMLPVNTEEENLLVMMNTVALKSGVILNSYTPDTFKTQAAPGTNVGAALLNPLHAIVTVVGTFPNIQDYLTKLESSGRFMDITAGAFSAAPVAAGTKTTTSVIQLRINVTAYFQAATRVSEGGVK